MKKLIPVLASIILMLTGCSHVKPAEQNVIEETKQVKEEIPAPENIPSEEQAPAGTGKVTIVEPQIVPIGGEAETTITIDPSKTKEPISKYIYGQFIEHQGRCIYGGIWAEMIEDRKFLYPVGFEGKSGQYFVKSPWTAVEGSAISMDTLNPFVGDHTPNVKVNGVGGITQTGIGLVSGKKYDGRIVLAGEGIDRVRINIKWGQKDSTVSSAALEGISKNYKTMNFSLTTGGNTENGIVEIIGEGKGYLKIGAVSLMPSDNIQGMRADVITLLKELNSTVYRWPGGNFANSYNWKQAIGDRDKRPPKANVAYFSEMVEPNDFGPDEFMKFLETLGSEAYIAVSATGLEDANMAADEVEYFNGAEDSVWGKVRAANGHPSPYKVKFWGVGNENWVKMPADSYIPIHDAVSNAMLKKDPSISIIAVGAISKEDFMYMMGWTEKMLQGAKNINLVGEHIYAEPSGNLLEHVRRLKDILNFDISEHRKFRKQIPGLEAKGIKIAFDEWNWAEEGGNVYGEGGVRFYFRDVLGTAEAYHEMFRNTDIVYMANSHPVNVFGQVKTTKTSAALEVTGLVQKLYRAEFGTIPVDVSYADPLDVMATLDGKALVIGVVNPTAEKYTISVNLVSGTLKQGGKEWFISSNDLKAYNEPGKSPKLVIQNKPVTDAGKLEAEPLSVSIYRLEMN